MEKKQILSILLRAKKELDFYTDEEMLQRRYNEDYYKPVVKKYKKNKNLKKFLKGINKNIYKFNLKELNKLGFYIYGNKLYLVPLWFFRLLPKKTKLISLFDKRIIKKNADDDIRFKCVAYGFEIKKGK